ncbi:recombination protein RecR [Gammaproteobacteria bacterium LSUCC0112]|nr:recombination protein RecR [Gammaproteobacteria bacterium LSUCC0112]
MNSPIVDELIQSLRCLPGVGPKTAQRMALYLLERNRAGAARLSESIGTALERVGHCEQCRTLTEDVLCHLCSNPSRDSRLLCVVGSPADLMAIEQTGSYRGLYFVLAGHLSPIDGVGPREIGIDALMSLLDRHPVQEIILANNPTVEGEATAYYIAGLLKDRPVLISRIAHGVPVGGELEYVDGGTLSHAFNGRQQLR